MTDRYTLPCAPGIKCEDRFSILDSDELEVPFWKLLDKLLEESVQSSACMINILENITIARRGRLDCDHGFLREYMQRHLDVSFYTNTWPVIKELALRMPELFPGDSLPILSLKTRSIELTREQTACLVVHQFLCTLDPPTWQQGFQDFHIWYGSEQPHPGAVQAYLGALFAYFSRLASDSSPVTCAAQQWTVTYALNVSEEDDDFQASSRTPLCPINTIYLEEADTSPSFLGLPNGASVISANKFVGFGRTGTQEETHVGGSPEACPAVLVTPPLQDDQALVITGAEAMVSISGYGRDARLGKVNTARSDREAESTSWHSRTMLFMDALELDMVEDRDDARLPVDVQQGNVQRELRKALVAFRRISTSPEQEKDPSLAPSTPYEEVFTGYWGCRTFGGNVGIKTLIQWVAASEARVGGLKFICSGPEQAQFGEQLMCFVDTLKSLKKVGTSEVKNTLLDLTPEDFPHGRNDGEAALDVVLEHLRRLLKES